MGGSSKGAAGAATAVVAPLWYPTAWALDKAQDAINAPAVAARKAAEEQAKAAKEQSENQNKLFADRKAAEDAAAEQSASDSSLKSARRRQKTQAAGAQGRSDTILTSPLGVTTPAQTAGKTLLGA